MYPLTKELVRVFATQVTPHLLVVSQAWYQQRLAPLLAELVLHWLMETHVDVRTDLTALAARGDRRFASQTFSKRESENLSTIYQEQSSSPHKRARYGMNRPSEGTELPIFESPSESCENPLDAVRIFLSS